MKKITTAAVLFLSLFAEASRDCATTTLKKAEKCENLKVIFDLSKCGVTPAAIQAQINCKNQVASASVQVDSRKWTTEYSLKEGKWGKVDWKQSSRIQFENQTPPISSRTPTEAKPTDPQPSAVLPDLKLKWGGYFDFRHNSIENDDIPTTAQSGQPESGFSIEEAALTLTAETQGLSFTFDLPVRREKTVDNVSETSQLVLGYDRAQMYLKLALAEQLNLTIGQFDTPYGVELNDSKDRVFVKTGLLYDYALPVTHTGLSLDGMLGAVSYRLLAANSNNKGSFGQSAAGDNQTEVGATLGYANDTVRTQLGYLSRPIEKSDGQKGGVRQLFDVSFGFNLAGAAFDFEFAQVENDNKASDKSGQVFLFLPTYKFGDSFTLGLRFEALKADPGATGLFEDAESMGISFHWNAMKHLQLRSEVLQFRYNTQSGGTESEQTRVTFTSLFSF